MEAVVAMLAPVTHLIHKVSLPRRRRLQRSLAQFQAGPVTYLAMIEQKRKGAARRQRLNPSRIP